MYAMGVFLAGLTGWLLLRALRRRERQELSWAAYGVAVAAFCYTHYFAFFTVCAQALFAAGESAGFWVQVWLSAGRRSRGGIPFRSGDCRAPVQPLVALVYGTSSGRKGRFLDPAADHARDRKCALLLGDGTSVPWADGVRALDAVCEPLYCLDTVVLTERDGFFSSRPSCPGCCLSGFRFWSGRPILVERYLVFAQFALLGFWGVTAYHLPAWPQEVGLACLVCLPGLIGLSENVMQYPGDPPALAAAADFLKENYRPGDVITVSLPGDINRLRYYAYRAGIDSLDVRCRLDPSTAKGHVLHLASVGSDEVFWTTDPQWDQVFPRLWTASDDAVPADHYSAGRMRTLLTRTFDGGGSRYTLTLYKREKGNVPTR